MAAGESNILPPSSSLLCVSQRSSDRCVYQSSGEGKKGIKRRADVCSCAPDYGVEWMAGEPAESEYSGSFSRGLRRG